MLCRELIDQISESRHYIFKEFNVEVFGANIGMIMKRIVIQDEKTLKMCNHKMAKVIYINLV